MDVRDFALLASYVDTMASLRPDGMPELANFLALALSREKAEALVVLQERLKDAKLDKPKFERAWSLLRNSAEPLSTDMLKAIEATLRGECKMAGYDLEKLKIAVEPLVSDGTLTAEERDRLLLVAQTNPQTIGRVFGAKMRFLSPVLKQSQT